MKVSGPVTGGSHGWPFGGPGLDLAEYGYVQEEYFLEGTASRLHRRLARSSAGTAAGRSSPSSPSAARPTGRACWSFVRPIPAYLNAIQPTAQIFDEFLLLLYFGGGAPLEVGEAVMTVDLVAGDATSPRIPEGVHLLRDDVDIPVMIVNTECEALSCYGVWQPDTDRSRYWEVAGASHVSLQVIRSSAPRLERDFGLSMPIDDDTMGGVNQVSMAPVVDAALDHLNRWLRDGTVPPVQPRIAFEDQPPAVVRDVDGIARGGIRLPSVEVPVAHNIAIQKSPDVFARLMGSHEPFSAERLHELYPTREEYLARFERAARAAEAASVILPRDVEAMVEEARATCPL
jgi:hypothetical protein